MHTLFDVDEVPSGSGKSNEWGHIKAHQEKDNQQHEISGLSHLYRIQALHRALLAYSVLELYHHLKYGLSENGSLYRIYSLKFGRKDASLHISYRQSLVSHLFLPRLILLVVLDMHHYLSYNGNGANDAPHSDYSTCLLDKCQEALRRINTMGKSGPKPASVESRFWQKVAIGSADECWLWQACTYHHGYGKFALTRCNPVYAHRLAYELTYGAIPDGLCILHRCDVRACCNPNHLFLGTQLDNIADMNAKGRGSKPPKPESRKTHKGWKDADTIRSLYATGHYKQIEIAQMFGIRQALVSQIVRSSNEQAI